METEGGKPMNEDRSGQKAATEVVSSIRDRIVELRRVPFRLNIDAAADEILATRISRPKTWRDIQ